MVDEGEIRFFLPKEEYGFLSNFIVKYKLNPYETDPERIDWKHLSFKLDGIQWKSVQHYFEARKFSDYPEYQVLINNQPTAIKAIQVSNQLVNNGYAQVRPDWYQIMEREMYRAIVAKFSQNQNIYSRLLDTGNRRLIFNDRRNDYWGIGPTGKGQNRLGKLIMIARQSFQIQELDRPVRDKPSPELSPESATDWPEETHTLIQKWINLRTHDLVRTLVLFQWYLTKPRRAAEPEGGLITQDHVLVIVDDIYDCRQYLTHSLDIGYPTEFKDRVLRIVDDTTLLPQMPDRHTPKLDMSDSAIQDIWVYLSFMTDGLLRPVPDKTLESLEHRIVTLHTLVESLLCKYSGFNGNIINCAFNAIYKIMSFLADYRDAEHMTLRKAVTATYILFPPNLAHEVHQYALDIIFKLIDKKIEKFARIIEETGLDEINMVRHNFKEEHDEKLGTKDTYVYIAAVLRYIKEHQTDQSEDWSYLRRRAIVFSE